MLAAVDAPRTRHAPGTPSPTSLMRVEPGCTAAPAADSAGSAGSACSTGSSGSSGSAGSAGCAGGGALDEDNGDGGLPSELRALRLSHTRALAEHPTLHGTPPPPPRATGAVGPLGLTENGAPCLASTGDANLNLFAAPLILFDGERVDDGAAEGVCTLHALLEAAYAEDRGLAVSNILFLGNLREGGKKNHPAYMVALAWLFEKHPRTFLAAVAPVMASNACERDILTLYAVVTPNTSFPLKRLWEGEQCDAAKTSKRATLEAEEKRLWNKLIADEFPGKKTSDLVRSVVVPRACAAPLPPAPSPGASAGSSVSSPMALERDPVPAPGHSVLFAQMVTVFRGTDFGGTDPSTTRTADPRTSTADPRTPAADPRTPAADPRTPAADPCTPTPTPTSPSNDPRTSRRASGASASGDTSSCSELPPSWQQSTEAPPLHGAMRSTKRNSNAGFEPCRRRKNVWNEAFRLRWHELRRQLHQRNYGCVSGVSCSAETYQAFTDFVVGWFAERLLQGEQRTGKWAPTADGAVDKATKGVREFDLPLAWAQKGGISQAIAFKMFGHTMRPIPGDVVEGGGEHAKLVALQKRHVMAAFKRHVSGIRSTWVPEHLVGNPATVGRSPDFTKATSLWLANSAHRVLKTPAQKEDLKKFYSDVEKGVKGCTVTSGGQKPYVLFEACCVRKPGRPAGGGGEERGAGGMDEDGMDEDEDSLDERASDDDEDDEGEDTDGMAEWRSERKRAHLSFGNMIEKLAAVLRESGVVTVPVADTSPSMSGVPMRVSVALGTLLARANSDLAYRNKVLSFDSECSVTTLDTTSCKDPDAVERCVMKQMRAAPWGASSNLESVMFQVARMEKERLAGAPGSSKKLVVVIFSDMEVCPPLTPPPHLYPEP